MTNQTPKIVEIPPTKLIGLQVETTLTSANASVLWRNFRSRYHEILNKANQQLWNIHVYPSHFSMENFTPNTVFQKWAAVEVVDFEEIPNEMEKLDLKGGLYAVFDYKGRADASQAFFQYIFGTWLPQSAYELANREHFEIFDTTYHPFDEQAQEKVFIPIRNRNL